MKNVLQFASLAIMFGAVASCQQATETVHSPKSRLITNVHVVDVANGMILENQMIAVDSGRILEIGPELTNGASYAETIDAQGAFAVPGLTEMHAHIPSPPVPQQRIEETLFLYLSNGVTTIRGMLGHPSHLLLKQRLAEGSLISPRIITSSPSLNGNTIPTPEEAENKVRQYAADGYDFLKIHPGVPRAAFDALATTAHELEIPFAGHVPVAVGIRHALESGYATVDHVDGYLEGLVPESAGVAAEANGFFGFNFTPLADTTRIEELVELTRENGVWVVPTQSLFERWFAPATADSLLAQPEMRYMPQATLDNWRQIKEQSMADPSWDPEQWEVFDRIRLELIRRLAREGQGVLLGSDAPQLFNVPGFSIHHEIAGMQRAGLTPAEILRAGTLDPARFFGLEDQTGSLEAGKEADFFLVSGNPMEDLGNLRNIQGLMLQGNWFSKAEIDRRLETIAANAQ